MRTPIGTEIPSRRRGTGFTLVELLVVIGIIAVLLGMLMPALSLARAHSRSTKCMANLRTIGQAMLEYAADNRGYILPAYDMPQDPATPGVCYQLTSTSQILDGWPCILDRDGYITAAPQSQDTVFYCPDTFDQAGMNSGQTGTIVNGNQGWMDWPWYNPVVPGDDGQTKVATTDPAQGFNKIIRCSYWINSNNPVSTSAPAAAVPPAFVTKDWYFTTTPGYGVAPYFLRLHKTTDLVRASDVVAFADGIYGGRQSSSRQTYAQYTTTMTNRIAYRHPGINGSNSASNVCFADGHVEHFGYTNFPVPVSSVYTHDQNQALVNTQTVYGNPTNVVYPN
jgi:prepilin-type N-terminal cleavage/methylation domain-containing protein/prepilin-type processing-associated H-X9-DG protein